MIDLTKNSEWILASILFAGYAALWSVKRVTMKRTTGIDPQVMGGSESRLQQYFGRLTRVFTFFVPVLIIFHATNFQMGGLFDRLREVDLPWVDICGFISGLCGLLLCGIAQYTMGRSWRVGVDTSRTEPLITGGLYRFIRNPTYTGLMLVCFGLWLIWPTIAVASFAGAFGFFLEVQTRVEEDFLASVHGEVYRIYFKRTNRYIPFIY